MNEDKQYIESYLRELEPVPLLTEEEIRQLITSRATALQRVVTAHLHLVVPIAKEYMEQDRDQVDLILKGNIGLIQAVETFDTTTTFPERKTSFSMIERRISAPFQPGRVKHRVEGTVPTPLQKGTQAIWTRARDFYTCQRSVIPYLIS